MEIFNKDADINYKDRIKKEIEFFRNMKNVHELPDIFHYWSNKYLLPKFQALGFTGINEFF